MFKKTSVFNYRPMVSIWLFLMAGIIFTVGLFTKTTLSYILSGLMLASLIATAIFKLRETGKGKLTKVLAIVVSFIVSSLITFGYIAHFNSSQEFEGNYVITGYLAENVAYSTKDKVIITLEDCEVTSVETNKKQNVSGFIKFYLEAGSGDSFDLKIGAKLKIYAELSKPKLVDGGEFNAYAINKNISAYGFGYEDNVETFGEYKTSLIDRFKIKIKDTLDTFLSEDYSSLAYTMLFGDKAGLSEEISTNYSASGIGHLLAVSGLHVGFVVTILSLILKLFKANKKARFVVITVILFIYVILCEFAVSVVRAFIMTTVGLYFKMRERRGDSLSALAMAGGIILLISPLELYNVGFRLSFGAVAGIILFSTPLERAFNKAFHESFAKTLSVACAVQIGTIPFMLISFQKLSVFSIVTNLIAIPIASVAYMVLFAFLMVSFIIPPLGMFTYLFEFIMKIVTAISSFTGALSFANVHESILIAFGISIVAVGFFSSNYLKMNKKLRISGLLVCGVLCISLFIGMFI